MPAKVHEQNALAVARANGCGYCLAAHSVVGRMVGLTAEQIRDSRLGNAVDPKADALIRFALKVLEARGSVGDGDLDEVRGAGFDDAAITEVVANVALHVLRGPNFLKGSGGRGSVRAALHQARTEPRPPDGVILLGPLTNYFNRMAETDLDFPKAPELKPEPATTT